MTRYALVRDSIAYFAAPSEEQVHHDMGADDAVCELPYPLEDMLYLGELSAAQAAAIGRLEDLIARYYSRPDIRPWNDEAALSHDPEWAEIRSLASDALKHLPDREIDSDAPPQLRNGS